MDIYSTLLGASFITLIVLFGIAIVTLVGKWKVYAKLGMPGWYSLIPVFSDYKLCERVRGGEENKTFLIHCSIALKRTGQIAYSLLATADLTKNGTGVGSSASARYP